MTIVRGIDTETGLAAKGAAAGPLPGSAALREAPSRVIRESSEREQLIAYVVQCQAEQDAKIAELARKVDLIGRTLARLARPMVV
jgi:hypothetical protein